MYFQLPDKRTLSFDPLVVNPSVSLIFPVAGIDDGFWKGECEGRRGIFPSLVVEELDSDQVSEYLVPGETAGALLQEVF